MVYVEGRANRHFINGPGRVGPGRAAKFRPVPISSRSSAPWIGRNIRSRDGNGPTFFGPARRSMGPARLCDLFLRPGPA
jgi:hypothetical protein